MCVDPDWMPFEKIAQGKHIGMSADFMRLFASRLNINIVVTPSGSWFESLKQGEQRQCDIFSLLMATPERKKFLDFTQAYLEFPLVIAVSYQQDYINSIEEVLDKELGVQKGYAYAELLQLQYPDIKLIEVPSLNAGLDKVSRNQLYGMIGSLPDISYAFQERYIGELKIAGKLAQQSRLGIGTRNDEPLLVGIFDKAIASISEQQHHEITNDWIAIKYVSGTDNTLLIIIASVLTLMMLFVLYRYWRLRENNSRLRHLSLTDKLTSINNRMKLDQQLDEVMHMAKRYQHEFSVILIDIDHFKNINDEHGHLIGDYALKTLAQLMLRNIRAVDTLGRWGGEEFLIICPGQTEQGGRLLAEKLRNIIDQYAFEFFSHLSCSFGVAAYAKDPSVNALLKRADAALYKAKNQGRNQVCT
ncbi:diguanylate cyclase [Methyloprofundus sp.]|uniref:diguanylate cyclase n=1 Tax=Methyloprofundus sp. TaxID=2020875 RepID=UPI003D0D279F